MTQLYEHGDVHIIPSFCFDRILVRTSRCYLSRTESGAIMTSGPTNSWCHLFYSICFIFGIKIQIGSHSGPSNVLQKSKTNCFMTESWWELRDAICHGLNPVLLWPQDRPIADATYSVLFASFSVLKFKLGHTVGHPMCFRSLKLTALWGKCRKTCP